MSSTTQKNLNYLNSLTHDLLGDGNWKTEGRDFVLGGVEATWLEHLRERLNESGISCTLNTGDTMADGDASDAVQVRVAGHVMQNAPVHHALLGR